MKRLIGLFRRRATSHRLTEEFEAHIAMEAEHLRRSGMDPVEADRIARVRFGGRAGFRAEALDEARSRPVEDLAQDIRYGVRTLLRTPRFTAVAIATLALGIGSATVFFSVADHVVIRALPYPDAGRLVVIREVIEEFTDKYPVLPANAGHFLEWRRRCASCGELGAFRHLSVTMTGTADPEQLRLVRVSANLLPMLGARAALGRLFLADEDRTGADDRGVVLGDRFWRRLGADPAIVGRTLTLDGAPWLVVGVLAGDFVFPNTRALGEPVGSGPDLFRPLAFKDWETTTAGEFSYSVIGRLAPGAATARAESELAGIARELTRTGGGRLTFKATVSRLQHQVVGSAGKPLLLLLGAVAVVLLIVAINLAHLLLAQNLARGREWAVRVAVGAARGRLVRQTLTESLLLAAAGGAGGILLATWGLRALLRAAPADLPRQTEIHLDLRVLVVSLLVTMLVGLGFGALPAYRSSAVDPADALRGGPGGGRPGRTRSGRSLFVSVQSALTVVLLSATGLLITSFVRLTNLELGFVAGPVLALDLPFATGDQSHAQRATLFDDMLGRLRAIPGVTDAALTSALPLEGESQLDFMAREHDPRRLGELPLANILYASPGYFTTTGTPLRRGRPFDAADRGKRVVVLSEQAAATLWPNEEPLGKRMMPGSNDSLAEVIGIAADVRMAGIEQPASTVVYLPYWSRPPQNVTLVIKSGGRPEAMLPAVRAVLRSATPTVPVTRVRTLPGVVATATAGRRFQLLVFLAFGGSAIVIAAVGIYGIVAHSLAERRKEIGLRLALGASPVSLQRTITVEALTPVMIGLVAGLAGALAMGKVLASMLFEVSPGDPVTLMTVAAVVLLVGLAACWMPAHRATRGALLPILRGD